MATNISNLNRCVRRRLENFEIMPERAPLELRLYFSGDITLSIVAPSGDEEGYIPLETTLFGYSGKKQLDTPIVQAAKIREFLEYVKGQYANGMIGRHDIVTNLAKAMGKLDMLISNLAEET